MFHGHCRNVHELVNNQVDMSNVVYRNDHIRFRRFHQVDPRFELVEDSEDNSQGAVSRRVRSEWTLMTVMSFLYAIVLTRQIEVYGHRLPLPESQMIEVASCCRHARVLLLQKWYSSFRVQDFRPKVSHLRSLFKCHSLEQLCFGDQFGIRRQNSINICPDFDCFCAEQ